MKGREVMTRGQSPRASCLQQTGRIRGVRGFRRTRAGYGELLIERLSDDPGSRFGRGFGRSNLSQMRAFYLAYRNILPDAVWIFARRNFRGSVLAKGCRSIRLGRWSIITGLERSTPALMS
jgi:hypothetical protein